MSKIVGFREKVMQYIRDNIPEIVEVDWYEGLFSFDDVKEWSLKTPCAWVSVTNVPTSHHVTGEMNADLRVVVAIVDADGRAARDADGRVWNIMEDLAVKANLNTFGDPNAAPATGVKFLRISDPDVRAERISIGVVEWRSGLTIGVNKSRLREEIYHNGERVTQFPTALRGRWSDDEFIRDEMELTGEGYQGDSTKDLGVVEKQMVPSQRYEP
jgi:hypothetical protein